MNRKSTATLMLVKTARLKLNPQIQRKVMVWIRNFILTNNTKEGMIAHLALCASTRLQPGERVLIYAAMRLLLPNGEELLAQRGVVVSYETVRQWCVKFGQTYANELRRCRPRCGDTFQEWNEAQPGFLEVDLVAHCGPHIVGNICTACTQKLSYFLLLIGLSL